MLKDVASQVKESEMALKSKDNELQRLREEMKDLEARVRQPTHC